MGGLSADSPCTRSFGAAAVLIGITSDMAAPGKVNSFPLATLRSKRLYRSKTVSVHF